MSKITFLGQPDIQCDTNVITLYIQNSVDC